MTKPVVIGDPSSIFTRSILIALAEKGAAYGLATEAEQPRRGAGAPLSGEPLIEHGGFLLRGTDPILRYVDEALPGPHLQPEAPRQRARMNRALEIHFGEGARILGSAIVGRNLASVFTGEWISPSLPERLAISGRETIGRLAEVLNDGPFFAGDLYTLADAALIPLFGYLLPLPEAVDLMAAASPLRSWYRRVSERDSFRSTRPRSGFFAENHKRSPLT